MGQPRGRTSAGDPSENPCTDRGAAMAEVEAERGPTVVPEQYCSGWPSSASGAGSTAPGSGVEASVSRYPGCSVPAADQNRGA